MPRKGKVPAAASDLPDEGDPVPRVSAGDLPEEEMPDEEMPEAEEAAEEQQDADAPLADRDKRQRRIMGNRASARRSRARQTQYVQDLERNVRTEKSSVEIIKEQVTLMETENMVLRMDKGLLQNQIIGQSQRSNQGQIMQGQLEGEKQYRTMVYQDAVASAEAEYYSILQQGGVQAGVQAAADFALIGSSQVAPSGAVIPHGLGHVPVYAPPFNPQQPMATINQQQIIMPQQQEEMRGGYNAISELEEVNVLTAEENNDLDSYIQRAQAQAGPQAEPDNITSGGVDHDLASQIQQLEAVLQQDATADQKN